MSKEFKLRASCACGAVALEARGKPIAVGACHCDDCQAAAARIADLPGAPPVMDEAYGTAMVVLRKDRMRCVQGQEKLEPIKLKPGSPTRRYVATCCNSPMYLGFDDAKHWVDIYLGRIEGEPPPLQMRICTRFIPAGVATPNDVPSSPRYPFGMALSLAGAGIAMLLGR